MSFWLLTVTPFSVIIISWNFLFLCVIISFFFDQVSFIFLTEFLSFWPSFFHIFSKTLKYRVGVQQCQSYLMVMFYIDQLCTPSFPIELIKTESGFLVKLVLTGLGRWMLVVAMISVDAYPFLAFSDLTCHLEDMGIGVSGCTVPPDDKETKFGSCNQEASPS